VHTYYCTYDTIVDRIHKVAQINLIYAEERNTETKTVKPTANRIVKRTGELAVVPLVDVVVVAVAVVVSRGVVKFELSVVVQLCP